MAELRRVRQSCEARRSRADIDVSRSVNCIAARRENRGSPLEIAEIFNRDIHRHFLSLSSAMILILRS